MGGLSHMDCVTAVNLLRVVHNLKQGHGLSWNAKRGNPLFVLKQWLRDKGWQITRYWVWAFQDSFCEINLLLSGADGLLRNQHNLRDGWRWFMFGKFLNQERHDNQNLNGNIDNFFEFDFPRMRGLLDGDPAMRTLLLGAARSPAIFSRARNPGFPTDCIWGCKALGSWSHITWECSCRPSVVQCDCPMSLRFGWIRKQDNLEVPTWCAKVVHQIWDTRYGRSE